MDTIENETFGFKIDIKKWKKDLQSALQAREDSRKEWQQYLKDLRDGKSVKYQVCHEDRWTRVLTKLYTIRAHARGRLHRLKARFTCSEWRELGYNVPGWQQFIENNGTIVMPLTLKDQEKYLDDIWQEYEVRVE